ncbi:MAG: tetratricopeptide repeat protein [Sphingorhabdus sp.]
MIRIFISYILLAASGMIVAEDTAQAQKSKAEAQQKGSKEIVGATKLKNVMGHCDIGNAPLACIMIADHYGAIAKSKGQYDDRRRDYTNRACSKTPRSGDKLAMDRMSIGLACRALGEFLRNGIGGPKNMVTSTKMFQRSCDFEDMNGCAYVGESYQMGRGVAKDEKKALAVYKKSCRDAVPISCYKSVRMIFWDAIKGQNAPHNQQFALARRQSDIACNKKWSGQISSCWYRGFFMMNALGGPANPAAALKAYQFTCANSQKENGRNACYNVARIRLDGPQNLRDKAKARTLLTAGCTADYKPSCDRLKKGL